jgi:hypothetical protein
MPITLLMVLVLQRDARTRWIAALLTRDPTPGGRRPDPEVTP